MNLSHKIKLNPNKAQETALSKAAGVARFTYNWALDTWSKQYKAGKKPNTNSLKKEFNSCKRGLFPWVYDSPKDANQQPFTNLNLAFNKFFSKKGKYPTFKKKGQHDSFYVSNDKIKVTPKFVTLPKIGKIKLTEPSRFEGKLLSATISRKANYWFVSLTYDLPTYSKPRTSDNVVGLDLGINTTIMCSDKKEFNSPKPLKKRIKKLRKLSKSHSRKVKGSSNKKKSAAKLAKLHYRITNIRQDFIHKATSTICSENQTIVVEDLSVKGMMTNRKLARSLVDVSFGEIRRQLTYKANIYNNRLIVADRWFPSSKLCSRCGSLNYNLTLANRTYVCDECGLVINRDYNSSLNLRTLGYRGS